MFNKWALILAGLFFTQQIVAKTANEFSSNTESAAPCIECSRPTNSTFESIRIFAENLKESTRGALDIEYIFDKMHYSNKCDSFAADGEMNKWGNTITNELRRNKGNISSSEEEDTRRYKPLLSQGPKDIKKYCTNFQAMTTPEREALYVLILTAMAHYESSCNFREKAPGPNGTAAGLLQLHKGREQKYSSGCRRGDSARPERTLICGLSMLNDQIERGENLFSRDSYWEVLRPQGRSKKAGKIMAAIKKFPACGAMDTPTIANSKHKSKTRIAQK
ncbi:MAG TPA: hypothetical protein VIG33_05875 [Pseudobdellovibrionaceae bacterium]|jgi:hypothetical protein